MIREVFHAATSRTSFFQFFIRLAAAGLLAFSLNSFAIESPDVVINEIMYRSGSGNSFDEFIELYNSSNQPVDLSNWRINKGVSFTFPATTILNANAYIVVAANLSTFSTKYPAVTNVIGPWTGKLSNSGETIQLVNASGSVIDSVTYNNEGDWAVRARGPLDHNHYGWIWQADHSNTGKSLELISAAMPNQYGANWGASTVVGGTPGAANSIASSNIAPIILSVQHTPVIPKSTDTVTVTAHIIDEIDASATVTVYYRKDGDANFSTIAMLDDGLHGDSIAHDGVYGATLPTQASNAIVEFYVSATDTTSHTRTWPGPSLPTNTQLTNCLYQVDDTTTTYQQPLYKLIMTAAERTELTTTIDTSDPLSDAEMNGTFISVDSTGIQCRYRCGYRNRGHSSRTRTPHNFRVDFPSDYFWQNVKSINLNTQYTQCQYFGSLLFRKCSLPAASATLVRVRVNNSDLSNAGTPTYGFYAHFDTLDSQLIAKLYPDDSGGNLYRGTGSTASADLSYKGTDPNSYRAAYPKETNTEEDDWTDLIQMTNTLNNAPAANYYQSVNQVIDVDNWMRYFAVQALLANTETTLSSGTGDDYAMYCGVVDHRFKLHGYDLDTIIGAGDLPASVTDSLFKMTSLASMNKFIKAQDIAPLYFYYLNFYADTVFSTQNFNTLVDQNLTGQFPATVTDGFKNYMAQRIAYVRSQIPLGLSVTSTPTVTNGYPRTTTATCTLGGKTHAFKTRSVLVGGVAATWTAWTTSWTVSNVPLKPGINKVLIQSFDAQGVEFERMYQDVWYDNSTTLSMSGTLASDTTLTAAGGPYRLIGDLIIPVGVTLTVEPGTTIYIDTGFGIKVFGRLVAEGTDLLRIRMTRLPSATGTWTGITYTDTQQDNRLSFIDFAYADNAASNLTATNSKLYIDRATWTATLKQLLNLENSSLILKNSTLPTIDSAELLHFHTMPPSGFLQIVGNTFGVTTGNFCVCNISGSKRPGPIAEIWNNTFLGGSDDGLFFAGADAHVENNVFMNFHKNNLGGSDSHCLAALTDGTNYCNLYIARNLFTNSDHALLCRDGSFVTLQNNTIVNCTVGAVNFYDDPSAFPPPTYGYGMLSDGNIFWNNLKVFRNVVIGVNITVRNCIIPSFDLDAGVQIGPGNIVADPQFISPLDFHLKSTSPAIGHGPNGLDMGAYVPQGASIRGGPSSPTIATSATFTVDGPAILSYKYSLDGSGFSSETPITTPITLNNLPPGPHSIAVLGKNDAGNFQDAGPVTTAATVSKTWTIVTTPVRRVRINEVLADNKTTFSNNNTFPDMIELYNDGSDISLADMSLSDNPASPRKYVFPAGTTLQAGAYMVLLADSTAEPGTHVSFNLNKDGEGVYLYDTLANGSALIDSVVFGMQLPDRSIGRMPDGTWNLCVPTFGSANVFQPMADVASLKINEWLTKASGQFTDDFIELYNPSSLPAPLGGLYLTDNLLSEQTKHKMPALCFIAGTTSAGSGLVKLIADSNSSAGPDHLNFKLSTESGQIGLFDLYVNAIDTIIFGPQSTNISQGRSPNGADLISSFTPTPGTDNPLPPSTVTTTNLIPIAQTWKYDQTNTYTSITWQAKTFDDSTWPSGAALLYNEPAALPAAKNTPLTIGRSTYFFRTHFNFNGDPTKVTLKIKAIVDDGAIFYLNGTEVYRLGMATGTVSYTTLANRTVGDAVYEGPFIIPSTALVAGDNVMAVRVHQAATNSDDVVFGMTLDSEVTTVNSNVAVPVVINEICTRPSAGQNPFIELYNPTATAANISGWYLTDDQATPKKYLIPSTPAIAAGAYQIIDSSMFGASFSLSALGGSIFLYSADSNGNLTTYSTGFSYGASDSGVSFGRYVTTTGEAQYPAQKSLTPGAANSGPSVGPIVISEIMYHPNASGDSFIELTNITTSPVKLYDPATPANAWRVNGVEFNFPLAVELPAAGVLIVSSIDPQQFRVKYCVPNGVQIYGPYLGTLQNNGELIELQKPDTPVVVQGQTTVPYITVDAVRFGDSSPWPAEADGGGSSLERLNLSAYGNDPVNWRASVSAGGTPGNASVWDGGGDAQFWSSFGNWETNNRPASSPTTAIVFKALGATPYISLNDLNASFDINNLIANSAVSGIGIGGNALNFTGQFPALMQYGSGAFNLTADFFVFSSLNINGDGTGLVTLSGKLSGAGGIVKNGGCSVELSGGGAFSGSLVINPGGALYVKNSLGATMLVNINGNGALLRGTGVIHGSVLFSAPGGKVWPGNSNHQIAADGNFGTLTLDSLDLSSSTNTGTIKLLVYSPAAGTTPQTDMLVISNTLSLGGNSTLELRTQVKSGSYTNANDVVLIDASASGTQTPIGTAFKTFTISNSAASTGVKILYVDNSFVPGTTPTNDPSVKAVQLPGGAASTLIATNSASRIVLRLGDNNATVTPVRIGNFSAQAQGAGVLLSWDALSEFQNVGFNVYRRGVDNEWIPVNRTLIAGRITSPDAKRYRCCDWPPPGRYEYKLESVSIHGDAESFGQLASVEIYDVALSASDADTLDAVNANSLSDEQQQREAILSAQFNASAGSRSISKISAAKVSPLNHVAELCETRNAISHAANVRWFSANQNRTSSFTAAKVTYSAPGVLKIPPDMLPPGFDLGHVSIQREGRTLNVLALSPDGLIVFAQGYRDDYTHNDALFLRRSSSPTAVASVAATSDLFASTQPVNVTSPASVTIDYHDAYFDFLLRPYTVAPWFSNKYLSASSMQSFSIDTPNATSGPATLILNVCSLAEGNHTLQVFVNGGPGGEAQWTDGEKMLQLEFALSPNLLLPGANRIDLVTPGSNGAISFLHSMTVRYTRTLDGSKPLDVFNSGSSTMLFEVANVPAPGAWVVDARFADRATLVPTSTLRAAHGSITLRFNAAPGGSGRYLIVPVGQENRPLAISLRQVKPLRATDYLATGPSQFSSGAQPLLDQRAKEGLRGAVVDQEQLFDFYNFGRYGPVGIQNAVRAARPRYLLLLGRTTYDYHNFSGTNVDPLCPTFLVPTTFWAQATSDSLFGDLGRGFPEVAVGRLPVNNSAELSSAAQHVLSNKGLSSGWRAHVVADTPDADAGDFAAQCDDIAHSHPELSWQKNYLGATHQLSSEVTSALRDAANSGAEMILYSGHGNSIHWGATNILDVAEVTNWKSSVVLLQATCTGNWMAKNESGFRSIAIQALTQPQGGISASIGSSTYMHSAIHMNFMNQLLSNASNSTRWGDALLKTQQWSYSRRATSAFYDDLTRTEQLFGDPAMPVHSAKPATQEINKANGTF